VKLGLRELIFLIVLVAVPAASLFYVFRPHNERIQAAMEEIREKEAELVQLERLPQELGSIGEAIEDGRELIAMIEGKLPTERNVDQILDQVWQVTVGNGLNVKSVKTEKVQNEGLYRELPLVMVVEGDFDGFYRFLLELENLPRITRIHDMMLERFEARGGDDGPAAGRMKAEFTLSIYFQPREGLDAPMEQG